MGVAMEFMVIMLGVNLFLVGPLVTSWAAAARGRNPIVWFFAALLFTPIWMLPLVLVLDRKMISGHEKACPQCAENVKLAAIICRYCGSVL
ncbi:MAG: hypothetical protein HQL44_17060 [Alphaproteobacteria bacterium]|nr:hypothetical protein [Alphaproteobacteria bacterium]